MLDTKKQAEIEEAINTMMMHLIELGYSKRKVFVRIYIENANVKIYFSREIFNFIFRSNKKELNCNENIHEYTIKMPASNKSLDDIHAAIKSFHDKIEARYKKKKAPLKEITSAKDGILEELMRLMPNISFSVCFVKGSRWRVTAKSIEKILPGIKEACDLLESVQECCPDATLKITQTNHTIATINLVGFKVCGSLPYEIIPAMHARMAEILRRTD